MDEKIDKKGKDQFLDALLIATKEDGLLEQFLKDILTPAEYREVITRWQIVKRLAAGEGHRTIARDLKVGISTVTRGSRALKNGTGSFSRLLQKISRKQH